MNVDEEENNASGAAAPALQDEAPLGANGAGAGDGPSPFKKRRIEEQEEARAATAATEEPAAPAAAAAPAVPAADVDEAPAASGTAGACNRAEEEEGGEREKGKASTAGPSAAALPFSNGAPAPSPAAEANGKNKGENDGGGDDTSATAEAVPADGNAAAAAGKDGEDGRPPPLATAASEQPRPESNSDQQREGEPAAAAAAAATASPPLGAYLAREAHLAAAELRGDLSFEYVLNDGSRASSVWLAGLRSVYSKQLPNMPKEYVARLVFDRRHASVAIVRRGSVAVLGGITYRRFPEQRLGEIAFCAVAASEQVRGFGTRLMNHCKAFATSRDNLSYFLTYADNNAVGYFAKQGFTKKVTAPRSRWHGFVKDYDGGTLMECRLDPRAAKTYANLPEVLKEQRAAVDAAVRGRSQSHVVWSGLGRFREEKKAAGGEGAAAAGAGAGAATTPSASAPSSAALFEFAPLADPAVSVPGVAEAGWPAARAALAAASPPPSLLVGRTWRPASDPGALEAFAHSLLCELAAHEDAWPFLEPVDAREVPDYHQVVRDPMDFSTLKKRLAADGELFRTAAADESEAGEQNRRGRFYSTLDIFVADARRIFSNARAYNAADTIYSKLATRLEGELDALLAARISWGGGGVGGG